MHYFNAEAVYNLHLKQMENILIVGLRAAGETVSQKAFHGTFYNLIGGYLSTMRYPTCHLQVAPL
jgi:hypothetical protein